MNPYRLREMNDYQSAEQLEPQRIWDTVEALDHANQEKTLAALAWLVLRQKIHPVDRDAWGNCYAVLERYFEREKT